MEVLHRGAAAFPAAASRRVGPATLTRASNAAQPSRSPMHRRPCSAPRPCARASARAAAEARVCSAHMVRPRRRWGGARQQQLRLAGALGDAAGDVAAANDDAHRADAAAAPAAASDPIERAAAGATDRPSCSAAAAAVVLSVVLTCAGPAPTWLPAPLVGPLSVRPAWAVPRQQQAGPTVAAPADSADDAASRAVAEYQALEAKGRGGNMPALDELRRRYKIKRTLDGRVQLLSSRGKWWSVRLDMEVPGAMLLREPDQGLMYAVQTSSLQQIDLSDDYVLLLMFADGAWEQQMSPISFSDENGKVKQLKLDEREFREVVGILNEVEEDNEADGPGQ